jgi:hypothetical protein
MNLALTLANDECGFTSQHQVLSAMRGAGRTSFHFGRDNTPSHPAHQFRAVKMDIGWAFQHVLTSQYLGIPPSVVCPHQTNVTMVGKPFTWLIVPNHTDRKQFQYAQLNLS